MSPDYLALAEKRANTNWPPYKQPEDFGYDFRTWVSPYTKGAHSTGGLAIVLQDWASADGLEGGPDSNVQELGRIRGLLTNKRLEAALYAATGQELADTYATNAFPFIKPGGMSNSLRISDLLTTVVEFTKPELALAQPTMVIALGAQTFKALSRSGIEAVHLPHPAARGMSGDDYMKMWVSEINGKS